MSKSIFSYDKEKNCAYCAYGSGSGEGFVCQKGSERQPCRYLIVDLKPHERQKQ